MSKKLLLVLLSLFVVLGCGKSVVGTYSASSPAGNVELDVKGDKTFEAKSGPGATPVFSGTWEQKDKSLVMTMTKFGGTDVPAGTPNQTETATISDDGKQISVQGMSFTKQ
jgi:hypothetical protein